MKQQAGCFFIGKRGRKMTYIQKSIYNLTAAILIMLALVFLPSANVKAASGEGYHVSPQLYFAIDGDSVTYAVDKNDPSAGPMSRRLIFFLSVT